MVASEASSTSQIREIALTELSRGTPLRTEFEALHVAWIGRGVARWLEWIDPAGPHPLVVLGAFGSGAVLQAVVIGLWAQGPIARFDALFDASPPGADGPPGPRAVLRPSGGAWHFIAVTARPGMAPTHGGLGLGRLLVGHALDWVRARGHAEARTLSPVVGLPALASAWRAGTPETSLARVVMRSALRDGRPWLQILRLHLGGGARLERVLEGSRRDDGASGMANLRFVYATEPADRAAQRERWSGWCRAREQAMASGRGVQLGEIDGEELWSAPALAADGDVFADPRADD